MMLNDNIFMTEPFIDGHLETSSTSSARDAAKIIAEWMLRESQRSSWHCLVAVVTPGPPFAGRIATVDLPESEPNHAIRLPDMIQNEVREGDENRVYLGVDARARYGASHFGFIGRPAVRRRRRKPGYNLFYP
jgi:hypothetical protein